MIKNKVIIILISLIVISCTTLKKENIKVPRNISSLPSWKSSLFNINMDANLSVSYNSQSYVASANIRIANLDSLALKINGPFGIPVGKLFANQDNFTFYNALSNQIIEGKPTAENFNSVIKVPLSYSDFIRFIRCETPSNPNDYVLMNKLNKHEDKFLFKNDKHLNYIEYAVISLADSTLTQYQRKLKDGKLILHIFFKNYQKINGINYSMKQLYKFPDINTSLQLKVSNIKINPKFLKPFKTTFPIEIDKINLGN